MSIGSEIYCGDKWVRPTFRYNAADRTWPAVQSQLTESARNVGEAILHELKESNRLLRRLDRRLSPAYPLIHRRRK